METDEAGRGDGAAQGDGRPKMQLGATKMMMTVTARTGRVKGKGRSCFA